jgi:hypothetical protein
MLEDRMETHTRWLAAFILALVASLFTSLHAAAYSSGPPDGFAGDPPAQRSCTLCHGDGEIGNGSFVLLDLPAAYVPNQTYTLRVQLQDPGQRRWGFELTAIDDTSYDQAGVLVVTDFVNTQLSENPGDQPDYLKHTLEGTHNGFPDGPVTWGFQWTAPASGGVTFYAAGNAADGDGKNDPDDVIYLAQASTSSTVTVEPVTIPATVTRFEPGFPNPFRPSISIPFELGRTDQVVLKVYGVDGRLIATLVDGERPAGRHVVSWNGRDLNGLRAGSGVYFLALSAGGVEMHQRVVLAE